MFAAACVSTVLTVARLEARLSDGGIASRWYDACRGLGSSNDCRDTVASRAASGLRLCFGAGVVLPFRLYGREELFAFLSDGAVKSRDKSRRAVYFLQMRSPASSVRRVLLSSARRCRILGSSAAISMIVESSNSCRRMTLKMRSSSSTRCLSTTWTMTLETNVLHVNYTFVSEY
jgi:hypothetical protein